MNLTSEKLNKIANNLGLTKPKQFLVNCSNHNGEEYESLYFFFDHLHEMKGCVKKFAERAFFILVYDGHTGKNLKWEIDKIEVEDQSRYAFGERMSAPFGGGTTWDAEGNISPDCVFDSPEDAEEDALKAVRKIDPYPILIYSFEVARDYSDYKKGEIKYSWSRVNPSKDGSKVYHNPKLTKNFIEEIKTIPYNYRYTWDFRMYADYILTGEIEEYQKSHRDSLFVFLWKDEFDEPGEWNLAGCDELYELKKDVLDLITRGKLVGFMASTNKSSNPLDWNQLQLGSTASEVHFKWRSEDK